MVKAAVKATPAVTRLAAITMNLIKCRDKCVRYLSLCKSSVIMATPGSKNKDRSCRSFDASCILKGRKTFRSIFKNEITPGSS